MKWIGRIFMLMVIATLVSCAGAGAYGYITMQSMSPPDAENAPWALQTYSQDGMAIPSRIYYATDVEIVDGHPLISDYWILDGDKFKKGKDDKTLPANTKIVRRTTNNG